MKLLEERIAKDGEVYPGNILKIDSFLNHQIDVELLDAMGDELFLLFGNCGVNKILTIEASGIAIASIAALKFKVPVVFAKKSKTANISSDYYCAEVISYTHGNTNNVIVSKSYLNRDDNVLIIDDFLATGEALRGLIEIVGQSGAKLVGAGIAVEKAFQSGGRELREKGYRIESLAMIKSLEDGKISFC